MGFGVRYGCGRTRCFDSDYRSRRAVLDIELPKNVFDVLADRAGLCAENNANIVITFALRNPEEDFSFPRRQA